VECDAGSRIDLTVHGTDRIGVQQNMLHHVQTLRMEDRICFKAEIGGQEHGAVAKIIRGSRMLILVKLYTVGHSAEKWQELGRELDTLPTDYDVLHDRHIVEHRALFDRCRFMLDEPTPTDAASNETLVDISPNETLLDASYESGMPNALAERMWYFGRYLLISGTRTGGLPLNLTGLWSGEYRAFWAFNMANINLEMTYWQALPGGLEELMLPVFDYYDSAMDDMKENARKLYGCKGIFLPAVTMPGGMKHVCLAPHITNWTAGAGWMAQHYHDYWLYTRDEAFLRNRALPFMREAALFYLDFVVWQGDTWHVCPSVSPENHTRDYRGGTDREPGITHAARDVGDGTQSAIDSAMDVAVIRELFGHLLKIGHTTDLIPEEAMKAYEAMIKGAPAYLTNEWGAPREWLHEDFPDNDLHRHQSHLYPMFPGLERTRESTAATNVYRRGALRRMTVGLSHQTSWSLIQNAHTMARAGEGEFAWESLNLISKSCIMNNLFTTHNDWRGSGIGLELPMAPFQIDANTGWTSAVQEMLLFSDTERLDLLPALPKAWAKGSIGPLRTRCGVDVDIRWDHHEHFGTVRLTAGRETAFTVFYPDGTNASFSWRQGDTAEVRFVLD